MRVNKHLIQSSLVAGLCLASIHLVWATLVAVGWAQALIDFVFRLHMLSTPFQVQAFDPKLAIGLIGFTFIIGCLCGALIHIIKSKFSA